MKILHTLLTLGLLTTTGAQTVMAQHPDSLWYRYDDRFMPNRVWDISEYDTVVFKSSLMTLTKKDGSGRRSLGYMTSTPGRFQFSDPGRILYKPSSMNVDFTNDNSQWSFRRSKESEHFVCFWEKGSTADIDYILQTAERSWDVYAGPLGFVIPGKSSTDTYKILIRAYNTNNWIASGSGEDIKVGTLNLSPGAARARGGHTVAHEVGHTFQYLTNVDCGADNQHGFNYGLGPNGAGGNGFWEDCANWMAYKVYPERQFTDGEYFEGYMARHHQNLMHEDARYYNCFYQDFLCDRFGRDFIGRLWRESIRPEDPVDAIKRLQNLSHEDFNALMYDVFAHMAAWDTPGIREAAKNRVGSHPMRLHSVDVDGEEWYQVDSAHCPQNYGYNITPLRLPAKGSAVEIDFQGLKNALGYRHVETAKGGWRWGLVAQREDGSLDYQPMQSGETGTVTYSATDDLKNLWLVVMGAPTQWWHHEWDNNAANDEQWPYRIRTRGTSPVGILHTFTDADFPADYQRRNDTLVVHARLAYSAGSYSSVTVQYDMDAISQVLGISTEKLKGVKASATANPRFVGISKSGTTTSTTTTSTSSATVLGHWFSTGGYVTGYDSSAAIFAEMTPVDFKCKVGQYPGRLRQGQTYVVRQGIVYKDGHDKTYRCTMEVHLEVF